jgi:hypothetical protein
MEKLLKKGIKYMWNDEFQQSLDIPKENMVTTSILVFPYWEKEFHVHVYASTIALVAVLTQIKEGDIGHPIVFTRMKLSDSKHNCNTIEREGMDMMCALQKFRHYLLGQHFKMFTDHSSLRYLVNNPVLGVRICIWLLLFKEFYFEVEVKPGRLNTGPDHLSRITNGEDPRKLEDNFPDAQLFSVRLVVEYLPKIIEFFSTVFSPKEFNTAQKKILVVKARDNQLIEGNL